MTPRTEAGRDLLGLLEVNGRPDPAMEDYIAAIEAEARERAVPAGEDRLRAALVTLKSKLDRRTVWSRDGRQYVPIYLDEARALIDDALAASAPEAAERPEGEMSADEWKRAYVTALEIAQTRVDGLEAERHPSPDDLDRMTDEQFNAVIEGTGFGDRIRASLAELRAAERPPAIDEHYELADGTVSGYATRAERPPALCGCKVDAELVEASVCPVCGHRDHGVSGCRAATRADRLLPGGDGYPRWKDPLTGKDKDR